MATTETPATTPSAGTLPQPAPLTQSDKLAQLRIELSAKPIGLLINMISVVAGLISVIIIVSVVILALTGKEIPQQLSNWGGIILGFYFGQYITLVKDYMGIIQSVGGPKT